MIGTIRQLVNRFLGRGHATIAVPSFDGALKPNQKLEGAEILYECAEPEDLATDGSAIYLADGQKLVRFDGGSPSVLRVFDKPISALASLPRGELAVALAGREVRIFPEPAAEKPRAVFTGSLSAVNALAPAPDGKLYATDGSMTRGVDAWSWDLMEHGCSGRLFLLDPATGSSAVLAERLAHAFGCCATEHGALLGESWRHRLIEVRRDGSTGIALAHLPVYPSRLSRASRGGYWLTAFAARSLLVEFVLREPAYRKRMMAEIEPRYWIVPRLRSGDSFKEPMQGAHIKTMGVVKPWAPPRSYGLVVRLGEDGTPLYSLHSRVDGVNHGIVSAIEANGNLILIAKGPGRILKLPVALLEEELGR